MIANRAPAQENPDELYQKGRFAEAEKAYASLDMDHPKDIRYRYNRGAAAYQKGDYQGAMAAFSSVLKRAGDDEVRFRASYNLGNTAFKLGDFASAEAHYKKALLYNPQSEDARYNLELALRELEKQKKNKDEEQQNQDQKHSDPSGEKGDQTKKGENRESPDKPPREKPPEQSSPPEKDQGDDKGEPESGQEKEPKQGKDEGIERGQKAEQESSRDLSGELKGQQDLPEPEEGDLPPEQAKSLIDRKKAEALLDNIKEGRSRSFRFQIPQEKRRGVLSGKDW